MAKDSATKGVKIATENKEALSYQLKWLLTSDEFSYHQTNRMTRTSHSTQSCEEDDRRTESDEIKPTTPHDDNKSQSKRRRIKRNIIKCRYQVN